MKLRTVVVLAIGLSTQAPPVFAETSKSESTTPFEWRVKDRFRLFDQASQGARDEVNLLLDRLAEKSNEPLSTSYEEFLALLSDSDHAQNHAADLRHSNYVPPTETTGRSPGRYEAAYLYPDRYVLEIRSAERSGGMCSYASTIDQVSGACGNWTPVEVPPGDGATLWAGASGIISTTIDSSPGLPVSYSFADETIVALGDSFISGEGNPDRPSLLRADEPDSIFERPSWGSKIEYGKQLLRKAEWWDEPCHRSLLSWPVLASLAHAARDAHRAVTLVHLGCSGAVTGDLILYGETDLPGGGNETESQLALLDGLLLRPSSAWQTRDIDKVLLSIGGNDIGFVGVLTTLTLPPNGFTLGPIATRLIGKEAAAVCPYKETGKPLSRLCETRLSAEERVASLEGGYANLAKALARLGAEPSEVFHALYPNPLIGANGEPCDNNPSPSTPSPKSANFGGFEALMGVFPKAARGFRFRSWRFEIQYVAEEEVSALLYPGNPLVKCDPDAEPEDSEVCQALLVHTWLNDEVDKSPFANIERHVAAIDGHGLCVVGDGPDLSLPLASNGDWKTEKTPANFNPYLRAENGRWFRVPNDSILTQFDIYDQTPRFHQGTIHPTFRAHLEYAQAALTEALEN